MTASQHSPQDNGIPQGRVSPDPVPNGRYAETERQYLCNVELDSLGFVSIGYWLSRGTCVVFNVVLYLYFGFLALANMTRVK
jgi:hypothetical protein